MALGDEVDQIFRREVKSLPAYVKAQAASGSGIAPPVDRGLYGQYPLGLRVLLMSGSIGRVGGLRSVRLTPSVRCSARV